LETLKKLNPIRLVKPTQTTIGLRFRTETSTSCGSHKTFSGVLHDNKDRLGSLPGSRRKNADPLGEGHKFRQGLDLHFLHHPVAMGLNGTFGPAQRAGDLLVGVAANDKFEDFPLARRQCRDMSANHVQLALQATRIL
jgi:hypothetical protein